MPLCCTASVESEPLTGSHTHNSMREGIALLWLAFWLFSCLALIMAAGRWWWFRVALGIWMLGRALGQLAINPHLTRSRQWLGLSSRSGYGLQMCCYVIAGGVAMVAAFMSLPLAFGLIVAFGAFCWVCLWVRILVQFQPWKAPCTPASPDTIS
jgi:hypothetical protein